MKPMHLDNAQRDFFALVSEAAFANPFGTERGELDARIGGSAPDAEAPARIGAALDRVRQALGRLKAAKRDSVFRYGGADREMLEIAHLFDVFHQFIPSLDKAIHQQIAAGEGSVRVASAPAVLAALEQRGFTRAESGRYLAMFYQLRRAYYFIDGALVGRSPSMRELRRALWNNIFTHDITRYARHLWNRMEDFSTLLLGETGTGKGAAATAIGRSGFIPYDQKSQAFAESFMKSFIAINLSQFPESLIESELFGHRKGAFTGAVEAHAGVLARCSAHGAIFLDEIGDVSLHVQTKLLQVLQERTFSPVGSHEKRRFCGRIIAATNRAIDERRRDGLFRDDFFYRLCSDVIVVPPLRQRIAESPQELELLTGVVLERILGERTPELTEHVCAAIRRDLGPGYAWQGNVRELEQCVRRILLTERYAGDRAAAAPESGVALTQEMEAGTLTAEALVHGYCRMLYERLGTYEEVGRRTGLDRRTVKKYVRGG